MKKLARQLYKKWVSEELRYRIYLARNPDVRKGLLQEGVETSKATFSLKPYLDNNCLFIHITKTAGISLATGLAGALPTHARAWQIRIIVGEKAFNEAFKFAIVRNPWDRLYSSYKYIRQGGWNDYDKWYRDKYGLADVSFEDFVLKRLNPAMLDDHLHFWPQSVFVYDKQGRLLVDHLGRFENLADEYRFLQTKFANSSDLEHLNSSAKNSYMDVYTPEMVEKVASLYHQDITNFGYRFDNSTEQK
ncbi:sulfotransferase family 2 domain-containing protein [Salinimonas lutimaris]|uniref:sulfotransferase family 2 domain-containing protein n=1 Tax=Salinimonas lutimaris TaxID=914153 RepID=UPI0010C0FA4C|nr:sulfotransferase family 2 domain-containing protein [Salinimonas lutimaris]